MAEPAQDYTVAHRLLADCLGFVAVTVLASDTRWPAMLTEIDAVLPHCRGSREPVVADLVRAALDICAAAPGRTTRDGAASWAIAMMAAQAALGNFFQWRAAHSQEALRRALATEGVTQ